MLKKVSRFFRQYKQLGFVIITVVAGGVLDVLGYHTWAHWILGTSALLNVIPLLWGMVEDIRDGSYGIDILAATAIVTSVLLHEYWAGMVIVLMLTGGESLEDYAEHRAKRELSSLLERKPKQAHVKRGKRTIDVRASEIIIGDKVVILPGEVVPVDGEIIEGSSSFDESDLTGESVPITKQVGDPLMSGAVNIEGAITVRATHTADESQYAQIIKLVKSAAASQSPFVRLADRYSIPFTVVAFIIAGATWLVSGHAIRFLEVIVVATPCPLLLAAPIALISGMSRSAKHGIIVKTGSSLERLAEAETVAFDKTGTLTKGTPVVDNVTTFNKFTKAEVLRFAAAVEQNSTHVLANAIVAAAQKVNTKVSSAKQVREVAGNGLRGRLQGKTIHVGRQTYLETEGIALPKAAAATKHKQTATYVAVNNKLVGIITFTDELRPETKGMLKQLRKLGIRHTLMVTGDNANTAQAIAKQAGIEQVIADALPGDKIHAIENIKERPVAFVGDGVNDAPVLTAADVGIALGARGSTAASESADVVIMLDDITKVASSIAIAKRTFFIARQSILVGIFISVGLMAIFATGHFKPIYGAALQELVDVTVIFNALRAHTAGNRNAS
ncbi:MAG TPA: heavy metal translocating P-type ATPase [Patescibacteria group bacterium]|nr:heavy metal translocating P-type ATPase [Patescibacteria group bacterium]